MLNPETIKTTLEEETQKFHRNRLCASPVEYALMIGWIEALEFVMEVADERKLQV